MPKVTCTPASPIRLPLRDIPEGVAFTDPDGDICFKVPYSLENGRHLIVFLSEQKGFCAIPLSWYDDYEDFTFLLYTGTVSLTWESHNERTRTPPVV